MSDDAVQPTGPARPPAMVASAVAGGIGLVALVAGWLTSTDALWLAAVLAGTVSLCMALYWRSQLIAERRTGRR